MPKKANRVEFRLRFGLICAALMCVAFIALFRGQDASALRQQKQLAELQEEAYAEGLRGDRLRNQLQAAETAGFREREARRRFGYVRKGVIRFVADGPSMNSPDEEPSGVPFDSGEAAESLEMMETTVETIEVTDKDWASLGS